MPDGSTRRRRNDGTIRAKWYAYWRALRFQRRFGIGRPFPTF
ncbi:MAG: hypothetical protein ACLP9L_15880 [Thermoguttaceae bacterium]